MLPRLQFDWRFITRAQLKLIGSYSGFAFVGALATSIAFQTDALVITAFIGAAAGDAVRARRRPGRQRALARPLRTTWVLSPTASELETRGETPSSTR